MQEVAKKLPVVHEQHGQMEVAQMMGVLALLDKSVRSQERKLWCNRRWGRTRCGEHSIETLLHNLLFSHRLFSLCVLAHSTVTVILSNEESMFSATVWEDWSPWGGCSYPAPPTRCPCNTHTLQLSDQPVCCGICFSFLKDIEYHSACFTSFP